jgi:GAF domain-containing protein
MKMERSARETRTARYGRIREQLAELTALVADPVARMATLAAVLHHKHPHFFWTGFYLLAGDELVVGPYQGPLACLRLARGAGVCWAGVNTGAPVVVPDVHKFPGHIACDSRSVSEIVVPLRDAEGTIRGVLDVDSTEPAAFDELDAEELGEIVGLVYMNPERQGKI